jgi:hypothetical protein
MVIGVGILAVAVVMIEQSGKQYTTTTPPTTLSPRRFSDYFL